MPKQTKLRIMILLMIILVRQSQILGAPITLPAVTNAALENSFEIKKQERKVAIQKAELQAAWSEVFPKLDTQYSVNYTDYSVSGRDPLAKINVGSELISVYPFPQAKYRGGLDISLTQSLYAGGRIMANIDIQAIRVEQELLAFQEIKESVLTASLEAFWNYYDAYLDKDFFRSCLNALQTKKQNAILKRAQGLTTRYQELGIELEILNAQEDSKKATYQCQLKYAELQAIAHSNDLPTTPNSQVQSHAQLVQRWNTLKSTNGDSDLYLKRQKLDVIIRQKMQIIESSKFLPEVGFRSGVNYFNSDNDSLKAAGQYLKYGSFFAAVTVNWNWFNGFKDAANSQKSSLEKEIAELDVTERVQSNQITTQQLTQTVENAIAGVQRTEKSYELAVELANNTEALRKVEKTTQEAVFDAQDRLRKSESNRVKACIGAELALIKWCQAAHSLDNYTKGAL